MLNILSWLEDIAEAKHKANIITNEQFNESVTGFNTLRSQYRKMPVTQFQEVISKSAFNTYMTDALSRAFFDQYAVVGGTWRNYTTPDTSPDLRDVVRYRREDNHKMSRRRATGSRKQFGTNATKEVYGADEYSEVFEVPWEVILNDDLRELMKMPRDMANAAATFEDEFVSSLYNNTLSQNYLIALGAGYAGSAQLDKAGLIAALTAMTTRYNSNGGLIQVGSIRLVVGQALAYTAAELFSNLLAYGTSESNILAKYISGFDVDPFIVPVGGNDPWYLFSDPNVVPAVTVLRLSGVNKPYVFTQESQVRTVSGTAPSALTMGSYDSGVLSYTVGTIIGGNADISKGGLIDPNGIYYSSGG